MGMGPVLLRALPEAAGTVKPVATRRAREAVYVGIDLTSTGQYHPRQVITSPTFRHREG
ncbi:hypothetical protein GMLC_30760 [Geomonas limicola]|uniref:Uncharacterized protein n=1 Tax=Geomonas limicola TaxID=2740186 RepID=A0A6V8NCH1_9BACT|nr:hypothetical protein GMLC_30760 [Geomonas limicola]